MRQLHDRGRVMAIFQTVVCAVRHTLAKRNHAPGGGPRCRRALRMAGGRLICVPMSLKGVRRGGATASESVGRPGSRREESKPRPGFLVIEPEDAKFIPAGEMGEEGLRSMNEYADAQRGKPSRGSIRSFKG